MTREQLIPAFIGGLIQAGVPPEQIEAAVSTTITNCSQLGRSVTGDQGPLVRAFAFEQGRLLERRAGE